MKRLSKYGAAAFDAGLKPGLWTKPHFFDAGRNRGALQSTLLVEERLMSAPLAARVCAAYNSAHLAPKEWSGMMMPLKAGDVAPDFEVPAVLGETKTRFRLSNFKGRRHVVLAFYALDWTPT